jgi:hypothetical protein
LETPSGVAYYSFTFYSPPPTVDGLLFTPPATPGEVLYIMGSNFYEVEKVVFRDMDGNEVASVLIDFDNVFEYSVIVLEFPIGCDKAEFIDVVCVSGTASKEFMANPLPNPISVRSDMPIIGDSVLITGEYFFNIEKIVLPNGVSVTDFKVNSTNREIKFKMPSPALTAGGKLKIVALGEEYIVPGTFYPYEQVLADFDSKGWWSWGSPHGAFTILPTAPPYISTGKVGRVSGTPVPNWWGDGVVYLGGLSWPLVDADKSKSDNKSLEEVALKFSFYTEFPFEKGAYRIELGRWEGEGAPQVLFRPYYNEIQTLEVGSVTGKWIDYEIPLTEFTRNSSMKTYGEFVKSRTNTDIGLYFTGGTEEIEALGKVNIFFDNFRFVVK